MDRVRLGRALGYGTRHAAKTVAAIAEAAATPSSSGAASGSAAPNPARQPTASSRDAVPENPGFAARSTVRGGAKQVKRSFWQPLATFSGALWLRVTGVFFALLAFTMANGAWRLRGTLHAAPAAQPHRLWLFAIFALLFAYFAVSSFVRASLKERRATA